MKKNIFNSGILKLVLEEQEFILKRDGNKQGRKYTEKGAYNLAVTIYQAKQQGNFKGIFEIEKRATERLKAYQQARYFGENTKQLEIKAVEMEF
jgi:hypothetical protein